MSLKHYINIDPLLTILSLINTRIFCHLFKLKTRNIHISDSNYTANFYQLKYYLNLNNYCHAMSYAQAGNNCSHLNIYEKFTFFPSCYMTHFTYTLR